MEKETLKKLKDWMRFDKNAYMKGWDEQAKTAYFVFPAGCTKLFDEILTEPDGIVAWLADNGFAVKAYITDYTYKTVGKFNSRTMRTEGSGYNRTLRNRVRLDISWE